MRRVEHEQIEAAGLCARSTLRAAAEQVVDGEDFGRLRDGRHDRGIAGHQRGRLDAMLAQAPRQRARDVGETAGLDERDRFPR